MKIRKVEPEGATAPKGYGLAYRDFMSCTTIWYPIGIHLIVIIYRWVLFNIYYRFAIPRLRHISTIAGYQKLIKDMEDEFSLLSMSYKELKEDCEDQTTAFRGGK